MNISVVIPTLNAQNDIAELLTILETQRITPSEIVIVDSESTDRTVAIASEHNNVRIMKIERKEFDHGKTRDQALRSCTGDIVLFLTQDAKPANDKYISNIIKPFTDPMVVGVSGRQLPKRDARDYERLIRSFNYPENSNVRSEADIPKLGIKTFFFSDACSAIRKERYLELGGYEYPILTDEDLFFAVKAIKSGYKIAYAADAEVYHSHNLSLKEQFRRNYIQGIEFKNHKDVLEGISLESEGVKLVKYVVSGLAREGRIMSVIPFGFDCIARYLGSKAGRK